MTKWLKTRVLGKGNYSTVYLSISAAPQRDCVKPIALKCARPYMSDSLKKEEKILNLFAFCQEILQCNGSETTMENGVLVHSLRLEYAPYGTLLNLIKKEPILESEVKVYTHMLLKGLSRIHHKGVVHCDLKPENILLFPPYLGSSASYQLKIADFGLSKTSDENLIADDWKFKFRGTPNYMSPESIAYGHIEAPLDIWSLGCIVLEMITGLPVWWNLCTLEDIMFQLAFLNEAPEIPNVVSKECMDFLSKCFVTNPWERWTADMLLNHHFVLFSSI